MTSTVVVVGAGPVGLTLACELRRRGVRVRLIDSRSGPATTSRAIATHPRTLEIYDQMGLVDEILPRGQRITAFTFFQRGHRLTRLDADYAAMPTRFPFTIAIDQTATEDVLRGRAAQLGVDIEWDTELVDFEQDGDGVTLSTSDGSRSTAHWLVGCDGGHSTVRKRLGLPLLGESSQTWLVADAQVGTELPRNSIYWVRVEGTTMMAVPMVEPGRWRLLDTRATADDTDPAVIGDRFRATLTAGLGMSFDVATPTWTSTFTFQQRMIPRMRVGRCFVCGDAAHVHSPASGQGMNTGIQEAFNLAWKLAMVSNGQAGDGLLDTYGAERVPVGRTLLASTRRATRLIQLRSRFADVALPVFFGVVRAFPALRVRMQREILGGVSGLGIAYPDSPLTHGAPDGPAPRPGERVAQVGTVGPGWRALLDELRDVRWTLLVSRTTPGLAELAVRHKDWLSVRTVTNSDVDGVHPLPDPDGRLRADLNMTGWLLIRPDGYLATRAETVTEQAITAEIEEAVR